MKVLVTGGAGYIGSVTTERLLDAGHEVAVFDNLERGHLQAIDPRARFLEGDLRDRARIGAVMKDVCPEAVMHFAAYALVGESMQKPERYFGNNVVGGLNLAEAMLQAGVRRIVFSSTCAVYGQPDRVPITEDLPKQPANPYGESKLMLERALEWYHRQCGFTAVFLRYFNACGATDRLGEDHAPETHLIPNVLKAALGQRPGVSIFGDDYDTPDGTCIRDYIHILDLAQAHILALTAAYSGPINLGTGTGYSVKQVVDTAREVTGRRIAAEVVARRPGDPARLVAGAGKAKQVLGWSPTNASLSQIIGDAWKWHLAHPRGYVS